MSVPTVPLAKARSALCIWWRRRGEYMPQKRAALSAYGGGDEEDTGLCRPQMRAALPAHDGA